MKYLRTLAATGMVVLAGTACADLEVTNLNAPDRERALATANDVENLIVGSFQTLWGSVYLGYPALAFSVGADAHSASWGNWGMRDFSEEPRKAVNNSPSYSYSGLMESPWGAYAAVSAANDGLAAIAGGLEIGADGANNARAQFFGKLVQGLAHLWLAVLYDKAFIVDETTNLEELDENAFKTPAEVYAAGIAKMDEALALAQGNSFEIPAEWVGYWQAWDTDLQVKFINGYKARMSIAMARTPSERDALPWVNGGWNTVMQWAEASFQEGEGFSVYDDGDNWSWMVNKTYAGAFSGYYGWGRVDVRHLGPSDTTANGFKGWLDTPVAQRNGINLHTPDSRVTGGSFDSDGSLYTYWGGSPFPASRGTYHYSNYAAGEWDYFVLEGDNFTGEYPELTYDELQFIVAEGMMRTGNPGGAMAIVNASRENGGLSPFTDPAGTAPLESGSATSCVPRPLGDACGSLLEALKYEKRIDLHHYGPGTEFFDDRGWGDLVQGTAIHLPVPGAELEILVLDIYTWGGGGDGSAPPGSMPSIVADLSPEAMNQKARGLARYNRETLIDSKRGVLVH